MIDRDQGHEALAMKAIRTQKLEDWWAYWRAIGLVEGELRHAPTIRVQVRLPRRPSILDVTT